MPSRNETSVAVFLGGRSPEHDVSVITGLQALQAIDQERFIAFPVYVDPRGRWLVGEPLASAVLMDKAATKRLLRGLDIPLLPDAVVIRGAAGLPSAEALLALLGNI